MKENKEMTIQLFLKDTLVAEYSQTTGETKIHREDLLPVNMREVGAPNPIHDTLKKQIAFRSWCSDRILNINRKHAKKILNALNLSQSEDGKFLVSMACHSVSLTDSYWTKLSAENDLNWGNINLFHNSLSKAVCHIALTGEHLTIAGKPTTPELTGQGAYAKAWQREEDDSLYLYKANGELGCESQIEVATSDVLACFNVDRLKYEDAEYNGMYCCKCKCLTDENHSIVPAEQFFTWCNRRNLDIKDEILKIDKQGYYKMMVVDYLVANTDRHGQNWGFYMNNETGKIEKLHPLFDHNNAFDKDAMKDENRRSIVEDGKSMKEAAEYAIKRCDFKQIKPLKREMFLTDAHYNMFLKRCEELGIKLEIEKEKKQLFSFKRSEVKYKGFVLKEEKGKVSVYKNDRMKKSCTDMKMAKSYVNQLEQQSR